MVLQDDVAEELELLVPLHMSPRVEDDLHGFGAGEKMASQPTTVQVMK
jgi:hypothetical protein